MEKTPADYIDLAKIAIELGQFSRAREYLALGQALDPAVPTYEEVWQQMNSPQSPGRPKAREAAPIFPQDEMVQELRVLGAELNALEASMDKFCHDSRLAIQILTGIALIILFQSLLSLVFRVENIDHSLKWGAGGIVILLIAIFFSHISSWRVGIMQQSIKATRQQFAFKQWKYDQFVHRG